VRAKYALDAGFKFMEKVDVNGEEAHPVYRWLRLRGSEDAEPLAWNFSIFLVAKNGTSVTRYAQSRNPLSIQSDIEALLEAPDSEGTPPVSPTS